MLVAIVGGGISGEAIKRAVLRRGAEARLLSRRTGLDIWGDDAIDQLTEIGADVIVEATGHFTMSGKVAKDFFSRSTRTVAAASKATGARHILLSIVNCELPIVQGYGYFAGKTLQEKIARAESDNLTVVRSTQWFEFAGQNLSRMKFGPVALVPGMTIAPVSLDAVANVVAECATGLRKGASYEVTGPDVTTLWEMTKALPNKTVKAIPVPIPGRMGKAFRDGTLVSASEAETVGPHFSEWLGSTGKNKSA